MHRALKTSALAVLAVGVGIQFIQPDHTNPPVLSERDIIGHPSLPRDVRAVLERSCFDCHSNLTKWPWYSHVAPVSWLIADDVKEGRRHLNFSEWQGYKTGIRRVKLEGIMEELDKELMPPETYLAMHREAVVSPADRERIIAWAGALSDSLAGQ